MTQIKRRQHGEMLAPGKSERRIVVENVKTAARSHGHDIAPAEAQRIVRSPNTIRKETRAVAVRINRIFWKNHGIVARERKAHDSIQSDSGAHQTTVQTAKQACRVGSFRSLPDTGFFHRAADSSEPG